MTHATPPRPWYREPWPWILISLPATAVVAGIATVWIAATSADGLVVGDYYKAGLAINQTLAREEAAREQALTASIAQADGALSLQLGGRLQAYPQQLALTLAHPTRPGMDQAVALHHAGGGRYRAALPTMPTMPAGKWHAQLTDPAAAWRLAGVLHTPISQPVTLTASEPVVHQPEGE